MTTIIKRINVLEEFIEQKVDFYLNNQWKWAASIINREDIIAYVLNKMPSYYATTHKEVARFKKEIKENKRQDINKYVRQAFTIYTQETKIGSRIHENQYTMEEELKQVKLKLAEIFNLPQIEKSDNWNEIIKKINYVFQANNNKIANPWRNI